jgi:hypothetical protein
MRKSVHLVGLSHVCVITMHGSANVKLDKSFYLLTKYSICFVFCVFLIGHQCFTGTLYLQGV